MSRITKKIVSVFLMIAIILSAAPISVQADQSTVLKKVNVLKGKQPTTNSTYGGIKNKEAATDGVTNTSHNDSTNTEISAGEETGGEKNGYDGWKPVYLQYDFGKSVPVEEIRIYRNSFTTAVITFKKVKVELSQTDDFSKSEVVFAEADVVETLPTKAKPQILTFKTPKQARYIRVWGQGQYIQNHVGTWKGYSNAVRFHEIEVIASVPEEGGNDTPALPEEELYNISKGKLPYVYGLTPSDIENISDDKWDNYAVHNSHGNRWLQFEYKNQYKIKKVEFKLEPGEYESVKISISNDPTRKNHSQYEEVIFQQRKYKQGQEKKVITLKEPARGKVIRFLVNKKENEPTKYSEIAIWATTPLKNEEKPEYRAPESKYNTLVWFDEFNGSSIDEEKWNIIDGMANHGAIYNRKAVSIVGEGENKFLSIRSKNYDTTEALKTAVGYDAYDDTPLRSHVTWSSGRLESKNKFSFQYGRMATRAKVNDSQGIWPAIWMLCQDETGHDEIDVLEYLGQDAHGAWTTNHYGIWGKNKASQGREKMNYEAWSQDFHVYEVEWDPQNIIWYIDGQEVFRTSNKALDAMHTRPMFPILETQVGDGWVGMVDFSKQETKQDSEFLIDWIRVYQSEEQPVVRFDDLESITEGKKNEYRIPIQKASDGLMLLTDGNNSYENKNNFFYGGQPRYEKNRMAVKENATDEQYIIYEVPGVKDVHLTAYYQTLPDKRTYRYHLDAGYSGHSIRETTLNGPEDLNFAIYTSTNGDSYRPFFRTQVVDNFIEVHPAYARTTFDAYNLPKDTRFVKIVFPKYKGKKYRKGNGHELEVKNTDIQLAKVTFLQTPQEEEDTPSQPQGENEHLKVFPSLREYKVEKGKFDKSALKRMVIVDNDLSRKNARVKEAVQLVNQEFAAYDVPTGQSMPIHFTEREQVRDGDIVIELKDSIEGVNPSEGFTITVDKHITIEAKNANGVMYALRTIMQYLQLHSTMPYGKIKDYPDTEERALHLDMGRKYFTPEWIKKTIRELSFMRVNAIQLHFSEHEGFRLESESHPDVMSEDYIKKSEMREIIAEAKKYGVDIIPSFDNPGHLRHALSKYPQYRLVDGNGIINTGALDITNPEARQFVKDFLKEYAELFADSKYFHIGGDEFIEFKYFWKYPKLQEYGVSKIGPGATGQDGYMSYIKEIAEYVHDDLGFIPRVWNDGIYRSNLKYSVTLPEYVQVCYWTQWDHQMPTLRKLLEHNHDLINVNDNMYYVLSNGNSYTKKPDPEFIYNNITMQTFPDRAQYKPDKERVKGLTYAIWCDIPRKETEEEISQGMHFSLRAMAEKAWAGKQKNGDYEDFRAILDKLNTLLDANKEMPEVQAVNYKQGLVEVLFRHDSNKNQVLGHTEMRVGEKGSKYQYHAPTFKEFEYKRSSEDLTGTFTSNKMITLHYEEITQLQELKNVIENKLQEKDFVAETYEEYKRVMTEAEALAQESNPEDSKITKMLLEIKKAEVGLVKIIFKDLYFRLHNPKPEGDYTRLSYRDYKLVVNELIQKIKGIDVEDSKLAEFTSRLDEAEKKLKPRQGEVNPNDKREQLRLAIEEAKEVKKTARYKNASPGPKANFDEALQKAQQYYDDDNTSDLVLALAANGLRNVTAKLDGKEDTPEPADKEALRAEIAKATALENSEKFNHAGTEKQKEFTEALEEARKLEKDEAAKKEDVDKASERLKKATEAIEAVVVPEPEPEPADKEALRAEIAKATALENSEKFNHAGTEKQKEFTEALEEARKLEKDEAAKKEDVDKASERLKKATEEIAAVVVPEPEPEPEPQPQPEPQPEVLLPYIPEVVEEPVKEEVIEEEEIALASPEELSKWTDGLEKATDKELVKRLLEQKATPEELVKHFSEEGLTQLAKQVSDVFVDEKAGTWYQKELAMAILLKLVNGYGDDTFRAENKVTGKELIAILLRAGKVTVEPNEVDWFMPYLEMAKKEKLLTEVNFDLNKELSREEVALLVYNFMMRNRSHRQLPNRTLQFQDKEEIATDLRDAVSYLYEKEIIKGYEDESYRPKSPVKRSEIVAIIYRMLKNK